MVASIDLSIVIVSWNVQRLLRNCLKSIQVAVLDYRTEIFVVDNASRDGSAEIVASEFSGLNLIANQENVGFGAGNNQALKLCQGNYILLINPDTLVPQDAIRKMIQFLEKRRESGWSGPSRWMGKVIC